MELYKIIKTIGKGSFGRVQQIKRKIDNQIFVWKEIQYNIMSEKEKEQLITEIQILKQMNHPHICSYIDRIIDQNQQVIYIIMEFCQGGDISELIKAFAIENKLIPEEYIWKVFSQIVDALFYLHNANENKQNSIILHRDIKPSNVFLDKNTDVKLGDFGLSKILQNCSQVQEIYAQSYVGTPYYMSPEQIREEQYGPKSDIWGLGCLIYEMCSHHPPFIADNQLALAMKIQNENLREINENYSVELKRCILWCLVFQINMLFICKLKQKNEMNRPSINDLCECPQISIRMRERKFISQQNQLQQKENQLLKFEKDFQEKEKIMKLQLKSLTELKKNLKNQILKLEKHQSECLQQLFKLENGSNYNKNKISLSLLGCSTAENSLNISSQNSFNKRVNLNLSKNSIYQSLEKHKAQQSQQQLKVNAGNQIQCKIQRVKCKSVQRQRFSTENIIQTKKFNDISQQICITETPQTNIKNEIIAKNQYINNGIGINQKKQNYQLKFPTNNQQQTENKTNQITFSLDFDNLETKKKKNITKPKNIDTNFSMDYIPNQILSQYINQKQNQIQKNKISNCQKLTNVKQNQKIIINGNTSQNENFYEIKKNIYAPRAKTTIKFPNQKPKNNNFK